ncbi:MAG TPA: YfhO family protein [Thermoanaerobaculia bacterium]|nr:YfhO family protein [Thermoanaerobaculia bacterium]
MFNPTWLYVAAIYALAVYLARRGVVAFPWRIAAFFYALVLIFLFKPMTQAWVNVPADFLQTLPPWAYVARDHHVQNAELNDVILQIVPWAHEARESWKALHVPLWNHLAGSGYPLLASAQSSALSPLRLLALPLPLGYAFTAEAAWKILIAATFTFLYCRRRGWSELASTIGAVSFAFSSFLIVWLHFPLVTVACFLPAVLLAIDLLQEKRTYARFLFAALLWTTMLYGGHPETVSHAFFLALLYVAWILIADAWPSWRERMRFVGTLASALIVAALLAAPFLMTFAEAVTKSKRYHELKVTPAVMGYYSDWASIIVLLQPHFFGAVPEEPAWGPSRAESITGFAGALGIGAWLTLLVHVIATRRWRSREAFFVIATVLVLGIFLAWPGISTLFHLVFRLAANARLRLLFCFLLALATAAAVDLLQRGHTKAFLAGVIASAALLLFLPTTVDFPSARFRDGALLAMLPSALVLVIAATATIKQKWREAVLMLTLVFLINELWCVGRNWNPTVPANLMYPKTPLIAKLLELRDQQPKNAPFRIVGAGPVFFPNVSALYDLEDARAHDPMANGRYLGVLRVLTGYDPGDYFARWENLETTLLDYLGVKYVLTPPRANLKDTQRFSLVYDGDDGRIFENHDALPRFYAVRNVLLEFRDDAFIRLLIKQRDWDDTVILDKLPVENDQMRTDLLAPRTPNAAGATLEIVDAKPTDYRLRVRAPRYSIIVSSIPYWPGWHVERFGRRVEPLQVNGGFLGFAVPAGEMDVRVWYDPWTWKAGVLIAALTALGLGVRWRSHRFAIQDSKAVALPPHS